MSDPSPVCILMQVAHKVPKGAVALPAGPHANKVQRDTAKMRVSIEHAKASALALPTTSPPSVAPWGLSRSPLNSPDLRHPSLLSSAARLFFRQSSPSVIAPRVSRQAAVRVAEERDRHYTNAKKHAAERLGRPTPDVPASPPFDPPPPFFPLWGRCSLAGHS